MGESERNCECDDCVVSRSCVLLVEGDNDSSEEDEVSKVIEWIFL